MKVQMKTHIEGSRNGVRWPAAGGIVDLPEGEVAELLAAGLATEPERAPKVAEPEKATARKAETRKRS